MTRRCHAEPLACAVCGPRIWFEGPDGTTRGTDAAIAATQRALRAGRVVAVKGLGGYHLACAATSYRAVARLREKKHRPDKPFAVMVRDLDVARAWADIGAVEAELLDSSAHPIVLVRRWPGAAVDDGVAPHTPWLGIMLPYTPLHH